MYNVMNVPCSVHVHVSDVTETYFAIMLQWNLSIVDTIGTDQSVLIIEVSLFWSVLIIEASLY